MSDGHSGERSAGWILAGMLFLHLLLLRNSSGIFFATVILLAVGALLRSRQIFAPAWLERSMFFAGILIVFYLRRVCITCSIPWSSATSRVWPARFLLRPVTPHAGCGWPFACSPSWWPVCFAQYLWSQRHLSRHRYRGARDCGPTNPPPSGGRSKLLGLAGPVPSGGRPRERRGHSCFLALSRLLTSPRPPLPGLPVAACWIPAGWQGSASRGESPWWRSFRMRRQFPTPRISTGVAWCWRKNEGLRWELDTVRRRSSPESLREPLPKGGGDHLAVSAGYRLESS